MDRQRNIYLENLDNFRFTTDGMEISFGDYQVWSFAEGNHASIVSYPLLVPIMKPQYISLLQLDSFRR